MSPTQQKLTEMIDCLPEQEQLLVLEIVKRFLRDDVATPDDLEAIEAARKEFSQKETVSHSAIQWE